MLDFLRDYEPKKVTDSMDILKGTFKCNFNHARIEDYSGDKEELKTHKFVRYELEICDGEKSAGRRFWKSVDISDVSDAGQKRIEKLIDTLWTLTAFDFDFASEESAMRDIQKALDRIVDMTVEVKAWGFATTEEKNKAKLEGREPEKIQTHLIMGVAKEKGSKASSSVPF